jgi:hydroxyethylthiazole kinase-like uncharacterized protein yjeF
MTEPLLRLLERCPLPAVGGDKHHRGTAVIVAGSECCPGAAVLAATAALRAGAGRVQIITAPAVATAVAIAVPESYVIGWDGGTSALPAEAISRLTAADAVLVGPGLDDDAACAARVIAAQLDARTPLLLDAQALAGVPDLLTHSMCLLCMPNRDEAEQLAASLDIGADVTSDDLAARLARRIGGPVAVRGEHTALADGDASYRHEGPPSLGTAGSGDVLAGIAVGLATRGLEHATALGWAIAVHSAAGEQLAAGRPNPGYLARELVDLLPAAFDKLRDEGQPDVK